jgi:isopenicillin-N N-acyltransferase like protein
VFPKYKLSGTPYEIGFQHGQLAKESVNKCINNYQLIFQVMGNACWDEITIEAQKYLPSIDRHFPELVEEMKGLAEGAEVDFESILAINSRSEILFSKKMLASDGCTSYGITPEKGQGITYIGQNWDFPEPQKETLILLEIEQPGKPKILMVTEAGIIGKIGLNSEGVGICMNALATDKIINGTPLHIAMRAVLNSKNLNDALNKVATCNIASAINFIIGHHATGIVNMEIIPGDYELTFPETGFVAHTNHLVCGRHLNKVVDLNRTLMLDTFIRLNRAEKLLRDQGDVGLSHLKQMQDDHLNYPQSICRHLAQGDPTMIVSAFAIAMDLKNQVMYITQGQPCENEFEALELK